MFKKVFQQRVGRSLTGRGRRQDGKAVARWAVLPADFIAGLTLDTDLLRTQGLKTAYLHGVDATTLTGETHFDLSSGSRQQSIRQAALERTGSSESSQNLPRLDETVAAIGDELVGLVEDQWVPRSVVFFVDRLDYDTPSTGALTPRDI